MHIKTRIGVLAAGLTAAAGLIAGGGVLAGPASAAPASSSGCAFTNGCATLHGVTANGSAVAMDAKYQNKTEMLIGFADNEGDTATSFDGDLHYGKGAPVTAYTDTALQANDLHFACTVNTLVTPHAVGGTITDGGNQMSVENDGLATFTSDSGTTLGYSGSLVGTAIDETASPGCTVVYSSAGFSGPFISTLFADAGAITESYIGGGVTQFSDSKSSGGGKFTFDTLPTGTATTTSSTDGDLDALTSVAVPGTYSSVGVTYTEADGSAITYAFELVVSGTETTTPGAGVPYYTFVFAPNGDWTSQCVTDVNGSGALRLEACTNGKDAGQDFTIGATTPGLLTSAQAPVRNLLAEATNAANSYLTDPSTSNPATPQSDASDELAPGGRELYVNGTVSNVWSWQT